MEEKEFSIDLMEVVKILKENRKPIAKMTGCVVIVAIVFVIIAWYFFPKYESVAMLQIRQKNRGGGLAVLMAGMGSADFLSPDSSSMDSYIEILKSRGVVTPVILSAEEPNFLGKYPRYEDYVKKRISAEVAKGSGTSFSSTNVLMVSAKADSPEKAQRVNQNLIDSFLKRVAELNSAEKSSVKAFLEERLKTAKEDLKKAETALESFKIENKILSPSSNAEIFTERIMEAEKQAASNRIELEAAQARLASINEQLSGSAASSADNVTLQHYNEELAKLETTRISYQDKYTDQHPRMIELKERIASLKAKIQEEVNKIASLQAPSDNAVHQGLVGGKYSAEGAVTVAKQKAAALQRLIDQNNAELAKMPAMEQQYIRLSRDYGVANEIYMLLTKQLEQTKITEHQEPTNVLVVDPPNLPDKPSFPRRGIMLMASLLLGLVGSCGYVIFKELQNHTIRSATNVSEYVGLTVFGCVPDKNRVRSTITLQERNSEKILDRLKEYVWKK